MFITKHTQVTVDIQVTKAIDCLPPSDLSVSQCVHPEYYNTNNMDTKKNTVQYMFNTYIMRQMDVKCLHAQYARLNKTGYCRMINVCWPIYVPNGSMQAQLNLFPSPDN